MTKYDFLGRKYGPGDIIVYAAASGRAINMVKAEVVEIKESGNVVVQPLAGSRWNRHGNTRYIDARTGKGIDRWAGNGKHIAQGGHYVHKPTGEKVVDKYAHMRDNRANRWDEYEYVPTVWKDYVQEVQEPPKKVTLTVTENIVLLESTNPEKTSGE